MPLALPIGSLCLSRFWAMGNPLVSLTLTISSWEQLLLSLPETHLAASMLFPSHLFLTWASKYPISLHTYSSLGTLPELFKGLIILKSDISRTALLMQPLHHEMLSLLPGSWLKTVLPSSLPSYFFPLYHMQHCSLVLYVVQCQESNPGSQKKHAISHFSILWAPFHFFPFFPE